MATAVKSHMMSSCHQSSRSCNQRVALPIPARFRKAGLHVPLVCRAQPVKEAQLEPCYKTVTAFAPATVANLGPGFDWIGCAVKVCVCPPWLSM